MEDHNKDDTSNSENNSDDKKNETSSTVESEDTLTALKLSVRLEIDVLKQKLITIYNRYISDQDSCTQNISEYTKENLQDSENAKQPDNIAKDSRKALYKQFRYIMKRIKEMQAKLKEYKSMSPQEISRDDNKGSSTPSRITNPAKRFLDSSSNPKSKRPKVQPESLPENREEISKANDVPTKNSGSKGKEAANAIYRYKKRSKTVSSGESSKTDSPVTRFAPELNTPMSECPQNQQHKPPEEVLKKFSPAIKRKICDSDDSKTDSLVTLSEPVFSTPESESPQNQQNKSPHKELNIISPAVKRKFDSVDSNPENPKIDETSPKTPEALELFGSKSDDHKDSKVTKKRRIEFDTGMHFSGWISNTLDEKINKSSACAFFVTDNLKTDEPQSGQNRNESEQYNLPSTSGLSNVGKSIFSDEESSFISGSCDDSLNDDVDTSLTSESNTTRHNEKGQSSSTSGNNDSQHSEKVQSESSDNQHSEKEQSGSSDSQQSEDEQSGSSDSQQSEKGQSRSSDSQQSEKGQSGSSDSQQSEKGQSGSSDSQQSEKGQSGSSHSQNSEDEQSGSSDSQHGEKGQSGSSDSQKSEKGKCGRSESQNSEKGQSGGSDSHNNEKNQSESYGSQYNEKEQSRDIDSQHSEKEQSGSSDSHHNEKQQRGSSDSKHNDKEQSGSSESKKSEKEEGGSNGKWKDYRQHPPNCEIC